MTDNKSRDIFYGVVAVATLIVALVGATLAYFSLTATSEEGAINAKAAVVSIAYEDGQQVTAQADELIPSSFAVVQAAYEAGVKKRTAAEYQAELEGSTPPTTACIDSNNKQVCSTYRFSIDNEGGSQIMATLNTELNTFSSPNGGAIALSYALYDLKNGKWVDITNVDGAKQQYKNMNAACDNSNPEMGACFSEIDGNKVYEANQIFPIYGTTTTGGVTTNNTINAASQEFELVIFLLDNGNNQDTDQGKQYSGTIKVELVGSASEQITGQMN